MTGDGRGVMQVTYGKGLTYPGGHMGRRRAGSASTTGSSSTGGGLPIAHPLRIRTTAISDRGMHPPAAMIASRERKVNPAWSLVRFFAGTAIIAAWFLGAMLWALPAQAVQQCGRASWYRHGTVTANGEAFDPYGMTAAHRTLPFNSIVRVTRTDTGQSITVRLNDRGPFIPGRIIDLALGAARALGMVEAGVVPVCIEVLP